MNIPDDLRPVGLARRAVAMFYDAILLFSLLFAVSIPIVVLYQKWTGKALYDQPAHYLFTLFLYGVSFLYFGGFWVKTGQTPGMKIWGIRLVSTDSRPIDWLKALRRFIVAILAWLPMGLGYIWALSNRERASWHDLASHTRLQRYITRRSNTQASENAKNGGRIAAKNGGNP